MKKTAKFKKFGLATLSAVLCPAVMITCFGFAKTQKAFAEEPSGEQTAIEYTAGASDLFEKINIQSKCKYGDKFTVPAGNGETSVIVTAPNGAVVAKEAGDVTANQVGNYTVTYKDDEHGASYSFNVYVSLDEDFFLRVDYNGADIPSYIQKNGTFKIPDANVVYYNDDNILVGYPKDEIDVAVYDSFNNKYSVGDTFTADKNGKTYLTYSVKVGKDKDSLKYFNQTFTVNVQSTFSDTSAPTLSVAGVSSDISVNRPVTLPAATATDSFDDNIKIEIEVLDPDGNKVRLTDVDKYGYGSQDATKLEADAANTDKASWNYPELVFDNDKAMTFYPVKTGDYVVRYTAYDDAGNKSAVREYHMTCKDFKAPDFFEIDDWRIPETWGLDVKSGVDNDDGGIIYFPLPTIVDNKDKVGGGEGNDISLYFRITDSDNSRTVLQIENVFAGADSVDSKFKGNSIYGAEGEVYSFEDGLLKFDFNKYHKLDSAGEATDLDGNYTVYYRARDNAQNTSSKTYTISLEKEYTDKDAPSSAEVTVPSYVSVNDEYLDIPNPSVADAADSRPHVEYRIYSDKENFIDVNGGERAEFGSDDKGAFLIIDKDTDSAKKLYLVSDSLYFTLKVTDKAGNVTANFTDDGEEAFKTCDAVVKVVKAAAKAEDNKLALVADTDAILQKLSNAKAGEEINAGGFNITDTVDMFDYTGFEVIVADPEGNPLTVTLDTINTFNGDNMTLYVKNITFTPAAATEDGEVYTITVRAFDVNGFSTAQGVSFTVAKKDSNGGSTHQPNAQQAAANIAPTGSSVNVKYQLPNKVINNIPESGTFYVARQITGGVFSVVGNEFTAKTQGTFYFRDGYINSDNVAEDATDATEKTFFKEFVNETDHYSASITDTAVPVIEVQGRMPSYAEKNVEVVLPSVIAYSENGNAKVELFVTNASGSEVKTEYVEADNTYKFTGKTDGEYTLAYTATYANATPVNATFKINIGDVVGPEFTVSGGTVDRQTVGKEFKFGEIKLADGEPASGVTITKTLYDPSREEVTDATVSGSYSSYAEKENNGTAVKFEKAGSYEVVYTATDSVGNVTTQRFTITVVSSGSSKATTITTLSIVLIVVAVVLLAGVIIYVVRFRKVKEKK